MNHNKAITLRLAYLKRRLVLTKFKYNAGYKAVVSKEIKTVQTNGVIFLDKLFKKLHKMGYVYNVTQLSTDGLYHVWGDRADKKIFGVVDPGGEATMIMMPTKVTVTHIGIPNGKQYLCTRDTFLVALLHPESNET